MTLPLSLRPALQSAHTSGTSPWRSWACSWATACEPLGSPASSASPARCVQRSALLLLPLLQPACSIH